MAFKFNRFFREPASIQSGDVPGKYPLHGLEISLLALTYVFIMLILTRLEQHIIISGVLSQFQVMISIYLAAKFRRAGYITAVCLNVAHLGGTLQAVFFLHLPNAIPGIIITLFTIVSSSIIAILVERNTRQLQEVSKQKKEITVLYEEIAASEEELRKQNDLLRDYYQVIKKNEEKLNFLAYFDPLTELANGKMIRDRLNLLIQISQKNQLTFAVVFIDLDHYKKINDTMGRPVGDLLIQALSSRLSAQISPNDLLGYLGGDQFVLIMQEEVKEAELLRYVELLRTRLNESIAVTNNEFNLTASFGIAIYPQDADCAEEMLRCAATAMYTAKKSGKNNIRFFSKLLADEVRRKIELENKLQAAVKNSEFFLVYQPEFEVSSKKIRGFEALVRWRSPELGLVSPLHFIPMLEETGLIIQLGEWILQTSCAQFKQLRQRYRIEAVVSVNISAVQLEDPSFVPLVKKILSSCELDPKYLELEITESVCIQSMESIIGILNELKAFGIQIALDDFGTGYSSLGYLQKLPIHALKIDKSFLDNINEPNERQNIVGSIISLAQHLGMKVIAEGVEDVKQLRYLENQHCDYMQGFLFAKPLPEKELISFLEQGALYVAMRS